MKVTFKIGDIEAIIEDEKETDRQKLLGDALGCIEALKDQRISLYGYAGEQEEPEDEDTLLQSSIEPGQAKQIIPDIDTFKAAYA